jgi:hypothetical protein
MKALSITTETVTGSNREAEKGKSWAVLTASQRVLLSSGTNMAAVKVKKLVFLSYLLGMQN